MSNEASLPQYTRPIPSIPSQFRPYGTGRNYALRCNDLAIMSISSRGVYPLGKVCHPHGHKDIITIYIYILLYTNNLHHPNSVPTCMDIIGTEWTEFQGELVP